MGFCVQVHFALGCCCMFVKDFKLPCRHAWAVALKHDMMSTRERCLIFYWTWVADWYWMINYLQGYKLQ
jgi:hypothetical protein